MVCALILWRSGFGLVMGKFHQFLIVIYPEHDNGGVLLFYVFIFSSPELKAQGELL